MLGGEPVQRAAYRPSTWWSPSGSRRQVRPVSTTGTRGGPGRPVDRVSDRLAELVQGLTGQARPGTAGDGAGKVGGEDSAHDDSSHRTRRLGRTRPRPRARARPTLAGQPGRPAGVAPRRRRRHRRGARAASSPTDRPPPRTWSTCSPPRASPVSPAMPSGRFFGFVIGGSQPAALAADWLVSAWDQNTVLRKVTPAVGAVEEVAAAWFLDLLGLPPRAGSASSTGATMANFTGLAAGRDALLMKARLGALPRARRLAAAAGAGRAGAALLGRPRAALPRAAGRRAGRGRRAGADGPRGARARAGRGTRPADDRAAPGRQPALRGVRPVRGVHRIAHAHRPGCTSTARSGSGRPPARRTATSPPASSAPTPGRRTRTRR